MKKFLQKSLRNSQNFFFNYIWRFSRSYCQGSFKISKKLNSLLKRNDLPSLLPPNKAIFSPARQKKNQPPLIYYSVILPKSRKQKLTVELFLIQTTVRHKSFLLIVICYCYSLSNIGILVTCLNSYMERHRFAQIHSRNQ